MSNRFNQANVAAFLTGKGCESTLASFISNFVVSALRSVSVHAEITDQTANRDFSSYSAIVAANGGDGFTVDYNAKKVGAGFYDHRILITTPAATYTVSKYVCTALDATAEPQIDDYVAVPETHLSDDAVAVIVDEAVEQIDAEITAELKKLQEAPVEEVAEDSVTEEAPVEEAPVEDAVTEEAPVKKTKKSKKAE